MAKTGYYGEGKGTARKPQGGFRFSHHGQQQGPRAHIRQAAAGAAVHHADDRGESWEFAEGEHYSTDDQPTALCRCGASKKKPYCDGSHVRAEWDPRLTASSEGLLEGAETFGGPELKLTDNENFCVFARFCDAGGRVWNLVGISDDADAKTLAVREANMCPGGRLSAWENRTGEPYEPDYAPSLG